MSTLRKNYDTVPRNLIWYCLRKRDSSRTYGHCKTAVVTTIGETEKIDIKVELHRGTTLSPFLFVLIVDMITDEIDKDIPWAMLFADNLALCDKSNE